MKKILITITNNEGISFSNAIYISIDTDILKYVKKLIENFSVKSVYFKTT